MNKTNEKERDFGRDDVDMEENYGDVQDIRNTKDLEYDFDSRDFENQDLKELGRQVTDG